jgi:hypothetical protein
LKLTRTSNATSPGRTWLFVTSGIAIATIKNVKSTPISHLRVMITKTSSMKIVRRAANQLLVPQRFDVPRFD